jgi:hypothetical protein
MKHVQAEICRNVVRGEAQRSSMAEPREGPSYIAGCESSKPTLTAHYYCGSFPHYPNWIAIWKVTRPVWQLIVAVVAVVAATAVKWQKWHTRAAPHTALAGRQDGNPELPPYWLVVCAQLQDRQIYGYYREEWGLSKYFLNCRR